MALKLFTPPLNSHSTAPLHLLAGFEDGRVAHFCYTGSQRQAMEPPTVQREECEDWELMWEEKGHREAGDCPKTARPVRPNADLEPTLITSHVPRACS